MDNFPNDQEYDRQCGEIFLTLKGDFIINCTLCDSRYKGFEQYATHIEIYHNTITIECERVEEFEELKLDEDDDEVINKTKDEENLDVQLQLFSDNEEIGDEFSTLIFPTECFESEVKIEIDGNADAVQNYSNTVKYEFTVNKTNDIRAVNKRRRKPIEKDRKYNCPHCEFRSNDKSNLIAHIARHSVNKRFLCSECPKTFYTRSELHTHMRTHTGERPFLCTMCGKGFTTSSKLRLHIKRHKNMRDQECTQCDMKFYTFEALKKHLVVHSDERPFQCTTCNATFKLRRALTSHMKAHQNSREFKCDLCSADFNMKCNLNSHRKGRHGISTN